MYMVYIYVTLHLWGLFIFVMFLFPLEKSVIVVVVDDISWTFLLLKLYCLVVVSVGCVDGVLLATVVGCTVVDTCVRDGDVREDSLLRLYLVLLVSILSLLLS